MGMFICFELHERGWRGYMLLPESTNMDDFRVLSLTVRRDSEHTIPESFLGIHCKVAKSRIFHKALQVFINTAPIIIDTYD